MMEESLLESQRVVGESINKHNSNEWNGNSVIQKFKTNNTITNRIKERKKEITMEMKT